MASVYTNDLRLEEIGSGEQSGAWGDTTNTNLELIAEAFSFGTEAITTNADTHATTIADGATDAGRAMFLRYTGAMNSAPVITLGPPTVSKMWFIENATTDSGSSGPYSILIAQGDGDTKVTIPNGHVKAVYSNGTGSGAIIVDAFAALSVGILGVTGVLTTTAATVFNGGFASNADSTMGTDKKLIFRDSAIHISSTADGDLSIAADDEIDITSTLIDINGALDVSGVSTLRNKLDFNATTELKISFRDGDTFSSGIQQVTADGEMIASSVDGDLAIRSQGDMLFSADGNVEKFRLNSTGAIFNDTSANLDFRIESNGLPNMFHVDGAEDKIFIGHGLTHSYDAYGVEIMMQLEAAGTAPYAGFGMVQNSNDADSSVLIFGKSRGTALASTTIVQDDDTLGRIEFQGMDGADLETGCSIKGQVDGTPGANDMPGRLVFLTTADGANSATERMRITSTGDVAIGSTTPESNTNFVALTIGPGASTGGGQLYVESSSVRGVFGSDNNASDPKTIVGTTTNHPLVFFQNNADVGRFDASENFTIKTGNLVIGANGKGIDFTANTNDGSDTSELLDDYEEGTFTPALTDNSGRAGTAAIQIGRYVRVGGLVHVQGRVSINGLASMNGNVILTGMPFSTLNATNAHASLNFGQALNLNITAGVSLCGIFSLNSVAAEVQKMSSTAGSTALTHTELSADGSMIFSGTYRAN